MAGMLGLLLICDIVCVGCSYLQVEIIKSPLLILNMCLTPMSWFVWMLSLSSLLLSCADLQGSFSLTLPVGNDFLPDIKLLVYAVFSDGEVVADVEQFEVEKCFRHKVSRKHTRNVIASLMCPGLLWFVVPGPVLSSSKWCKLAKPDAQYFWLGNKTGNLLLPEFQVLLSTTPTGKLCSRTKPGPLELFSRPILHYWLGNILSLILSLTQKRSLSA